MTLPTLPARLLVLILKIPFTIIGGLIALWRRFASTNRFAPVIAAFGVLFFGFVLFRILLATGDVAAPQPRPESVHRVAVAEILRADARPIFVAYGTVAAVNRAELRFATAGEVAVVNPNFRNGIEVRAGQELARLDDELLAIAVREARQRLESRRSNLELATRNHQKAERDHTREVALHEAGLVSDVALQNSEIALLESRDNLTRTRSSFAEAELALARAERSLRESRLIAPFDGVLTEVKIGVGQYIAGGQGGAPVAIISDPRDLEISFVVPAEVYSEGARLIDTQVDIIWKAGGREVRTLKGTITRTEGAVSVAEGGGRLYASPDADADLPPGAFVEVRLPSLPLEDIVSLPDTALFNNDTVYIINGEGRAEARKVEVLGRGEGIIYVDGALEDGQQAVTTRIPGLGSGVRVEAVR